MRAVVTNSSDEEQIKKAAEGEKEIDEGLAHIMSKAAGRAFMYELVYGPICHLEAPSLVRGDAFGTAFNEGVRSVGIALAERLRRSDMNAYSQMMKENYDA